MKKKIIALLTVLFLICVFVGFYLHEQAFIPSNNEFYPEEFSYYNNGKSLINDTNKAISVGIFSNGYHYHESHDHGINKDVVTELFNRVKLDYKIEVLPRARISSMLEEGSLQIAISTIENPERAEYLYFVPYFSEKNDVLVRSDTDISTEDELLSRRDIKVGIVRGYYYGEHYTELIKKLEDRKMIVQAKDTEHLYEMLEEDWIQVTFNNASSYLFYFDFYNIKDINIYDWAPEEEPLVRNLVFSKKYFSSEDVVRFQKTIDGMIEDGTLYKIFKRFLPEDNAKRMCLK